MEGLKKSTRSLWVSAYSSVLFVHEASHPVYAIPCIRVESGSKKLIGCAGFIINHFPVSFLQETVPPH